MQAFAWRAAKSACLEPILVNRATKPFAAIETARDTLGDGILIYKQCSAYQDKKPSSQQKYEKWLVLLDEKLGSARMRDLDLNAVDVYSDMIATELSPSNARFQVTMISNVWDACKKRKEFGLAKLPNPCLGAETRYRVKHPHQPWSDDLQDDFMAQAPASLRLAKLLLHFSAQRGGDCVKMKVSDFDGEGLFVRPEKTSNGTDLEPSYCVCPAPLRDALRERVATAESDDEFLLINERGTPNANSLSNSIREFMVKAGLRKKGSKHKPLRGPSMRGLRKNATREVAALLVGT